MIERSHPTLSVGAQCRLRSISRSSALPYPSGFVSVLLDRSMVEACSPNCRATTMHVPCPGVLFLDDEESINAATLRDEWRVASWVIIGGSPVEGPPGRHQRNPIRGPDWMLIDNKAQDAALVPLIRATQYSSLYHYPSGNPPTPASSVPFLP